MVLSEDVAVKKGLCMLEFIQNYMHDGYSHAEAEKLSRDTLDAFLAKRYVVSDSPKKKVAKNRKKLAIEERFNEIMREKRHWLQGAEKKVSDDAAESSEQTPEFQRDLTLCVDDVLSGNSGLTYEEAESYYREQMATRERARATDKVPSAEKMFRDAQRKRKHWLEGK